MSIWKKRKRTPENFTPADPHAYRYKPKATNLKLVRDCLNCKTDFTAETRFIRLCENCRKRD